jgi:hypothetical protein
VSAKPESVRHILESIADSGYHRGTVLRSFATLAACAVCPRIEKPDHPLGSIGMREDEYMAEIQRWKPEAQGRFAEAFNALVCEMDAKPYSDGFGDLKQEWGAGVDKSARGEFYTPDALCQMMARMPIPTEMPADGPLTLQEPACGTGRMVLAIASALDDRGISPLCMRATCIDVDRAACDMAYVNFTLWGIPAEVIHGNALSLEVWGSWRTPFWDMARAHVPASEYALSPWLKALAAIDEIIAQTTEPPRTEPSGQFTLGF